MEYGLGPNPYPKIVYIYRKTFLPITIIINNKSLGVWPEGVFRMTRAKKLLFLVILVILPKKNYRSEKK